MVALALQILLLSASFLYVTAIPQRPIKNTIFGDERLKGEAFDEIDAFSDESLRQDAERYRLPGQTKPKHYEIFWNISISPTARKYNGQVVIDFVATTNWVNQIVLHSGHTEITNLVLTLDNEPIATTYKLDESYQFLIVSLDTMWLSFSIDNPIVYQLNISFKADMRTDMYGIYESWFRNNPNDTAISWMASTQFQGTSARYAFPCYDEPEYKATFDIKVHRPATHRSWSNTRIRETRASDESGYAYDIYHRTPVMSTYLIALVVAEYESVASIVNDTLLYEVIGRAGALNNGQADYPFRVGQQLLGAMSEHTDYDFFSMDPNLKMTQAAIPDFSAGAMENWGLLTYREAYLLYDEQNTNNNFKQRIAYILAHEITHMWFGNLVTNAWWDVVWLNEGFARYYQYVLTGWVEDYMGFETRFITEQVHTSLLADSANNPHPLTNPGIGSPASVSSMFSTISYSKGASVIRMTEHLLGHEVHRLGLRNYLKKHAFRNTQPSDLFNELQWVAEVGNATFEYGDDFTVRDYYASWTEQPGHPVVNVLVNHQTGKMLLTQHRFNINTGRSPVSTNYIVPITFATQSNPDFGNTKPTHILKGTSSIIDRGSIGDEWVIFNKQQTGFYRVNYDDYTWDLITIALRGEQRPLIHEYNRAQIVDDVFQFARSGLMNYTRAFNILSFLENERSYAPWVAAMAGFSWLRNRVIGTSQQAQIENLMIKWATPVMNGLSYEEPDNEDFMKSYLRYQLAPSMCNMNVATCRNTAERIFARLVKNNEEVRPDSRNWVYCNGLRNDDVNASGFNFMWKRFQETNVYNEKILLISVLGCTNNSTSLNTFMNAIVQNNFLIRPQDYTSAWSSAVSGNEQNTQLAFTFFQNNLQTVIKAFGNARTPLSYIAARLRSEAEINEYLNWVNANAAVLGSSVNLIRNDAEVTRQSILWATTISDDINDYINNGDADLSSSTSSTTTSTAPSTEPIPDIEVPTDPDLPSSTSALFFCTVILSLSVSINFVL